MSVPSANMKLIVGLGNPGKQYEHTRHNLGFMVVDALAERLHASEWKKHHKANALVAEAMVGGEKCLMAKPQTFMNSSGEAVQALMAFYKLQSGDVIVAHDELDLPFGTLRISIDASAGGHNGVASVMEKLGTRNIIRLRMGIRGPQKGSIPSDKYVLLPFSLLERLKRKSIVSHAAEALECLAAHDAQTCMNRFN